MYSTKWNIPYDNNYACDFLGSYACGRVIAQQCTAIAIDPCNNETNVSIRKGDFSVEAADQRSWMYLYSRLVFVVGWQTIYS